MGETTTKKKKKKKKHTKANHMPALWFSLKKSLHCQSEPSNVHDPTAGILPRKRRLGRSGCSRSISNLKDVIHGGSNRHPPSCSPRSIGSGDFLSPFTHQVILNSDNIRTLSPTPRLLSPPVRTPATVTPPRRNTQFCTDKDGFRASFDSNSRDVCHKCGHQFPKSESIESHHLSSHAGKSKDKLNPNSDLNLNFGLIGAVSELGEGDSSRKIVEIICRSKSVRIDRILKIHNAARTAARFEEYREAVKLRAARLPKKHPRCLADGNELLRFHGTTVACGLGGGACASDGCDVCRIIRHGFSGGPVFTASTSRRAYDSVEEVEGMRKALVVCRVIAGRVHRPVENAAEMGGGGGDLAGFDSLAGKVGAHSNIEELYLLNPRALLSCFVVLCKP